MKANKEGMIIKSYLKERIILVLAYAIIVLIFLAVAGLYGYENSVSHMGYAAVLVAFFGICLGVFDYISYRSKCLKLYDALSKNQGESEYNLREPKKLPERLYYEIVRAVEEDRRQLISLQDEKIYDIADYYTMWTHQIKTPIAALQLVLQRDPDDRKTYGALEELFKIEQYAEMALHYARLDSMSSDMLFMKYDIGVIIKSAVKKYSLLFIRSGLSFSMEGFRCRVVTDEKWMSFVIEQILSNALKYTKKGSIRIYGIDHNGEECGGEVNRVVIEDTGMGISESDLPRIFERGFTGYNGRMDKKSTGIGLYLCKQIVDKLSHTIKVESEVGKGTSVILGFHQD